MRRTALVLIALLLATPAFAQGSPPHAWLFGTWSGGMFPPIQGLPVQACLGQPVVIFTRDVVMRATLTEPTLTQREIETARAVPSGFEFRFVAPLAGAPVLGISGVSLPGSAARTPACCTCSVAGRTRSRSRAAPTSPIRWSAAIRCGSR